MTMPENIRNFLLELADLMEGRGVEALGSVCDDPVSIEYSGTEKVLYCYNEPGDLRRIAGLTPPPE